MKKIQKNFFKMLAVVSRIMNSINFNLGNIRSISTVNSNYISDREIENKEIEDNSSSNTFTCDNIRKMNAVNRFISRFHPKVDITIKNVIENHNLDMLANFNKHAKGKTVLQLYHCTDSYKYKEYCESIFNNGLYSGSASNKGYGIYLASHSNYAYSWGGRNHVFICDVIVEEDHVGKFFSEIYSPENNWEYVVTKKELVFPRYLVEFNAGNRDEKIRGWTNALCPTCPEHKQKMDRQFCRCDCKQYPTADPKDIIEYS